MTSPRVTAAEEDSSVVRLATERLQSAAEARRSLQGLAAARASGAAISASAPLPRHDTVQPRRGAPLPQHGALLPQHGTREPLYFPANGHQLFAWLHRPSGAHIADVGLVICKPFGYESICANRSLREFADAAAAIDIPSLRFDYAGTGDAEDLPTGSDELAIWVEDILAAVQELQRRTGVARICLLGIRLGALLATLAAARSHTVSSLVLVAPVINGQRYLRELRRVQLAAADTAVVIPREDVAHDPAVAHGTFEQGQSEVSGFPLTAATIAALEQVDLGAQQLAPAQQILVIDRDDLPGAHAWAHALSSLGAAVDYQVLPGIVPMVWTAPHFSVVPHVMIAAAGRWLERLVKTRQTPGHRRPPPPNRLARLGVRGPPSAPSGHGRMLQMPDASGPARIVTERPLLFAAEPMRFGILTQPPAAEACRRGVILVNDGATYHVGANRLNVALARRWAREGCTVLRMDIAGVGESDARPGRRVDEAFPPEAIEDIAAAVRYLRSTCGSSEITLAGLCSGAYHCLRAAVAGLPVSRILLVNPQNYFWKRGMTVDDLQLVEIVRAPSTYRQRMLSVRNWGRLLRGEADVRRIAWVQMRHAALTLRALLLDVARRLRIQWPRDLGRELEQVVARGVQVVFVFARGEAGLDLLKLLTGSSLDRLGSGCRLHTIDGADHIFSQSGARRALEELLSRELLAGDGGPETPLTTVAVAAR